MAGSDQGWIPDATWNVNAPWPPPLPPHRFGGHRPWEDGHRAMAAIFVVARTGCRWSVLNATGIHSKSSARRRFQ